MYNVEERTHKTVLSCLNSSLFPHVSQVNPCISPLHNAYSQNAFSMGTMGNLMHILRTRTCVRSFDKGQGEIKLKMFP